MREFMNSTVGAPFTNRRSLALPCAALLFFALPGCQRQSDNSPSILEAESTRPLEREAVKALNSVRDAKGKIESCGPDAAEPLMVAEEALVHLSSYYLPLVEARTRAYNAYRHLITGQRERALEELEAIEDLLARVADGEVEHGGQAVRRPAERAAEARIAVTGGSADALELVDELATLLNHVVLKGPLELGDG